MTALILLLYLLMLPVTGMVPVLRELTLGRYPDLGEFEQHLFMSANMLGALICVPLAGLLSDWWRRRKPIIIVALLLNALSLWMLLLDWPYGVYLAWRFVEGCAHITALTLLMALAVDTVRQDASGKTRSMGGAMGLVGAAISLGVATGAPLGGWIGRDEAQQVLVYGAVLMLVMVPFAASTLRERGRSELPNALLALLRSLPQNHRLVLPYGFAFVDRLTVGVIVSTLSLYLSREMGMDAPHIGWIMALFLLPFSLLTWPAGILSQRWNPVLMMFGGSIAYGLTLAAVGWVEAALIPWLMFAGGVVASLMYAPSLVLVATLSGAEHKAMAMSGFNFAGSLGFVLGPILGGALVSVFAGVGLPAYPLTLALVGGLELLCVLLFLPWAWRRGMRA